MKRYGSSALVSGFEGQTTLKTTILFLNNIGDVFLIDEFYELSRGFDPNKGTGGGYGVEAINTIVEKLDVFRRLMVPIIAGYYDEMTNRTYKVNDGLKRRFPHQWVIYTYTAPELIEIFRNLIVKSNLTFQHGQSEPVSYDEDEVNKLQELTESLIKQARAGGYFVDSNAAGVALFIRKIKEAVTVFAARKRIQFSQQGRRPVTLENVTKGFKEFIDASGEPRSPEEVEKFDERKGDLVFFFDTPM